MFLFFANHVSNKSEMPIVVGPMAYSNFILLRSTPTFAISTSTTSPFCKKDLGFMKAPTPAGVPVITAVPAGIVVPGADQFMAFIKLGVIIYLGSYGLRFALERIPYPSETLPPVLLGH